MSQNGIRVVCFDLGGVLVRICRSWADGCAAAGLEVRGNSGDEDYRDLRRRIAAEYALGRMTCREFAEGISRALDSLYTPDEILRIHDAWVLDQYPGVDEIVARLNDADVTTACLSNTNHGHWLTLTHHDGRRDLPGEPKYPVVRACRHRYASHLLGLAKPDPAIYRAFEAALGVRGEEVLFFDDLPENVAAARSLGWRAEPIDWREPTAEQIEKGLRRYGLHA